MDSKRNSMLFWFPKIKDLDIPIPKTEMIIVNLNFNYIEYLDNPQNFPRNILKLLKMKAREIGYPIFLRTDHLSGKHEAIPFVKEERDLYACVFGLMEVSSMAELPINAFIIRKHLELDWKFEAFNGLPIAKERRYFINNGKVICHHPYWIEDAIHFWKETSPPPENWKEQLQKLNIETLDEIKILTSYTEKVSSIFDDYWSIDFAYGKDGTWYLIDMAIGYDSWHPNCKFKLEKKSF
jgi:hypothetical protein